MGVSHRVGGCWALNSGPLQEQQALLTKESFLHPKFMQLKNGLKGAGEMAQ